MKSVLASVMIALSGMLLIQAAQADMRCRNKIVSRGASKPYVLTYCGEPAFTEGGYAPEGAVERWYYYTRPGKFGQILIFVNGRLVKIESGERLP